MEKTVEIKTCKKCGAQFEITNKDLAFYKKISPKFNGEVFEIPAPTLCPDCRQQRRLTFRNERKLYKRKCDATWKDIISMFSPDKNYKVYNQDYWWSDNWDSLDYWMEYDFSRTFFEQFEELQSKVPRVCLHVLWNENCDFVNQSWHSKSCYLSYNTDFSENCLYSKNILKSSNCIDCLTVEKSDYCYSSIDINNWNKVFYSQKCNDCSDVFYCNNLLNCHNCFWCINLTNKKYCIFNEQLSKEEYLKQIPKLVSKLDSLEIIDRVEQIYKNAIKTPNIKNCENCSWDNLLNSKNVKNCFDCVNVENVAFCTWLTDWKDIYDHDIWAYDSSLHLEIVSSGDKNYNCLFSSNIWWDSSNILYSDVVHASENCFWCICIRNKKYCILNKQYTKEEYEKMVSKILSHMKSARQWWEFFPASISPFWYNETVANEYFPLDKEEIIKQWYKYSDYEAPFPKVEKIIPAKILPEDIKNIPDDILNWAIECEITKKPFRIIPQELEFYRKHNLPIPKKHPDRRHKERIDQRNKRKVYDRKCDKCWKDIKTTYSPDREDIVYCQNCYDKEMY